MTREGIIKQQYSKDVEPRPFSIFTRNLGEQQENAAWSARALAWGEVRFDEYGHFVGEVAA